MARSFRQQVDRTDGPIRAWSYSRLSSWERCAFAAKCKYVDKLKEPTNDAMLRGGKIHKKAESYINGELKSAPPELRSVRSFLLKLRKLKTLTEQQWSFDKNWQPVEWFSPATYVRMVVDAASSINNFKRLIVDHKTGKMRETHNDQLSLYALGTFYREPAVKTVDVQVNYIDHGIQSPKKPRTFERSEMKKLRKYWEGRARPMLLDKTFKPNPGYYCRWCHFRRSNNGPCQY